MVEVVAVVVLEVAESNVQVVVVAVDIAYRNQGIVHHQKEEEDVMTWELDMADTVVEVAVAVVPLHNIDLDRDFLLLPTSVYRHYQVVVVVAVLPCYHKETVMEALVEPFDLTLAAC